MHNLEPFVGKTIRSFQKRQGGEQVIIYFEDESFLIITADAHTGAWKMNATAELNFQGLAKSN